jgi:hypothetical protein
LEGVPEARLKQSTMSIDELQHVYTAAREAYLELSKNSVLMWKDAAEMIKNRVEQEVVLFVLLLTEG